jgi:putative heme-binding domain-containing protein
MAADAPQAGNEQVEQVMKTFKGRGVMADDTPASKPAEALKKFTPRPDLAIDLMAAEPSVAQPIYGSWDSQGRFWVTQYLQYPFPAGLKVVSYDEHIRAKFDKVPLPPPRGEKGADIITVFEDTNGTGTFDKHTDVLKGLNITTAALPGMGRVWVLNPPYLLSYATQDGLPVGDPEVELSGFGLEDTHSTATSLKWGMDGWLYGANGSTTTGNVSSRSSKNIRWEGQCIWRFHPLRKVFEIYAEGGGNTYSLEIDSKGRVFSGTNYGATRGMHYEQGSYGIKGWGKHGPLTNPYAFGWFEHMKSEGETRRFPQAFAIYEGGLLGKEYDGQIIAPNSLANKVYVSTRLPEGATFRTHDEADLVASSDRWFRPVWTGVGPDGAIYLADWYDTRLSHVKPVDDWDKERGRLYRVRPAGAAPKLKPFDLHTCPPAELLGTLEHRNVWFRKQAVLEIGWRNLQELAPLLREKLTGANALEALWALDALGQAKDVPLNHADPYVRRWSVKIMGERNDTPDATLLKLAKTETQIEVCAQILASAKKMPASLPLLWAGVSQVDDSSGHIPLLAWWALESKAEKDRADVFAFLREDTAFRDTALFREHLAEKLAKRYALAGGAENLQACADLIALTEDEKLANKFLTGIAAAFEGGAIPPLPANLGARLQSYLSRQSGGDIAAELAKPDGLKKALKELANTKVAAPRRLAIAKALAQTKKPEAAEAIAQQLRTGGATAFKRGLLPIAAQLDSPQIPLAILEKYEGGIAGDKALREDALRMLAARKEWALVLVRFADEWKVPEKHFTADIVRQLSLHHDATIDASIDRHWKALLLTGPTPEKDREMARIKALLQTGLGDSAKGQTIYTGRCAVCHKLFDQGGTIGPELTGYDRQSLEFWLLNTTYPSLEIREGFGAYVAKLKDGRILTGIMDAQGGGSISLKDLAGNRTTVKQGDIEKLEASPISIMPEGLLTGLSDAELKDFFAYLMK